MKKIVLASASPRRKELLEQIGLKFDVEPSNETEVLDSGLEPHELARKISLTKAEAVARKHKNAIIIAADTFGVLDGQILGKPHTENEAREMLQMLSGKSHSVITGFSLIDTGTGKKLSRAVETRVYIKKLTPPEIDAYVRSKEPLEKAGAYAIQGLGAVIVERIEGDYFNVMGLPINALTEALKEFGISVL
ncbi:MAG: Maf family protein [Chloroflexota bacterium]